MITTKELEEATQDVKEGIHKFHLTDGNLVDCRSKERLSEVVNGIPRTVYCDVCLKLNQIDARFKDFRGLARKLRYDPDIVQSLEQGTLKSNATAKLFEMWCRNVASKATVGELLTMLKEEDFKREDVVEILNTCSESTMVNELPYKIYSSMCMKLNIRYEDSHKDFRMLGEKMGFKMDVILSLEEHIPMKNPTSDLLQMWCRDSATGATVAKLIELLSEEDLGRKDVVETLKNYVKNGK